MKKVNFKGLDDIMAAIKGASLSWASAQDEKEGVETPDDDNTNTGDNTSDNTQGGTTTQGGDNQGGGNGQGGLE